MPKIDLDQSITVRPEDIDSELSKIDTLLNGRIDKDNIGEYTDETQIKLFPSMFSDFPSDTRDIKGMKFFATQDINDSSEPSNLFFNRLIDMVNNNKVLQTVSGTASFKLTHNNFEQKSFVLEKNVSSENKFTNSNLKKFFGNIHYGFVGGEESSNFKKVISIPKPPSFIPIITTGDESSFFAEYAGEILHSFDVDVAAEFSSSTSMPFDLYIGEIIDAIDSFEVTVIISAPTVGAEEYINISVTVTILCEDKP